MQRMALANHRAKVRLPVPSAPGKEVSMADSLAVHHVLQPAQGLFISQQFHQAFSNRSTLTTIMVAPPTVTSTGTGIDISGADMDR